MDEAVMIQELSHKISDVQLAKIQKRRSISAEPELEEEENKGSVEFQVFSFTNKIERLTSHLELHKKDFLSERGLRKILGKRQRLLAYLSKKNRVRYNKLIDQLNIREPQTR
ncbi:ribosomal protein S15 [Carex littledalei]|uniref:30S ribosomal protein S15 n=1 Tax=Carex littledalei TaxID=544730 RepID=A0A833R948_9POAL|nr:ribosomal protein S15 [Carex littledalei]